MIKSIKSKALALYWFKKKPLKVPDKAAKKLKRVLAMLHRTESMAELQASFGTVGFKLQKYKERGYEDDWEIRISGNWRLLFRFDGQNITEIEYTDRTH